MLLYILRTKYFCIYIFVVDILKQQEQEIKNFSMLFQYIGYIVLEYALSSIKKMELNTFDSWIMISL